MAYPYITQQDLEDRVSPIVVRRILDDDNDGSADSNAVARILKEASAKVAGYLRRTYDLEADRRCAMPEVVRITLDVAEAYLWRRFPTYSRGDWLATMQQGG